MAATSTLPRVVVDLQHRLLNGTWAPNEKLPSERDLAVELKASRTLVRQALRAAEGLGLVEIVPSVGTFSRVSDGVKGSPADDAHLARTGLLQCMEARTIVECGALGIIVQRASRVDIANLEVLLEKSAEAPSDDEALALDRQFHVELARTSGNRFVRQSVDTYIKFVSDHSPLVSRLPMRRSLSILDHRAVLDAVISRDVETARAVMTAHLARISSGITTL